MGSGLFMALSAYLTLTGTHLGPIEGSSTQLGREGMIEVFAVNHAIVSPRDPTSGRPTGKRLHKPFTILKALDRASPALHSVLTQNENLVDVTLRFFRPSPDGTEAEVFIIRLRNATLSSMQTRMHHTYNPRFAAFPPLEELAFAYQRIEWTWLEGAVSGEDDWEVGRIR